MKLILTTTIVLMAFAFAYMVESSPMGNERGESQNVSLMDIIQSILNDPEFLALSNKQQLHVLILMYNAIEGHYKNMGIADKKKRYAVS
jgi:hypothetical protein